MTGVVWERLRLEGFGRHRCLEARFTGGLQTWIAPNEAGKSTAVLGLLATVWGLPHLQDPQAFTWARFRAWSGGPHRGEVTLRGRDGGRYTITREFDRHAVRVVAHRPEFDEVVVEAAHNPNARKEVSPFEPWLAAAIGVHDLPLVLATFVVGQDEVPGGRHRLEDGVQALVSGAGGGSYRGALERLAEALRERTRSLRTLDIGLPDLRNDRLLERLEAAAADGRRSVEAGRVAADGTQVAQRVLREAEEAYATARSEAERWRRTVAAQRSWVDRRDGARREAARVREARSALDRARDMQRALSRAQEELDATWPAFARAPVGTDRALEELAAARRRLAEAAAALSSAEEALDARRAEAREALHDASRVEPSPAPDGRDWSAIGESAAESVLRLRAAAANLLRQVESILSARAQLRAAEAELAPIDVFRDVDERERRELLEQYVPRGRALAARLVRARTLADELGERMRRHAAAFAEVRALTDAQVDALRAFEAAWEARRDPWAVRAVAAVAGGAFGAFVVPWLLGVLGWGPPPWVPWVGAAAVAALAALAVPRVDATHGARAALLELDVEGDDETLTQRLRQREAFEAQRAQVEEDAFAFERVQHEVQEAEAAGRDFRDAVARFRAALPPGIELDVAYERWKVLAPRFDRDREALRAQVRYLADVAADELERTPAALGGPTAAELARFAAFQGAVDAPPEEAAERITLTALASWLGRLSEATWDLWSRSADEHDRRRTELLEREREHRSAQDLWAQRLRDAQEGREQARAVYESARRQEAVATAALGWLWPRLATHVGSEEAEGAEGGGAGEGGAEDGGAESKGVDPEGALIDENEVPDDGIEGLPADRGARAAAPWDPEVLRQGWAERRRAEDALKGEWRALEAHLAANGAEGREQLERALEHAELAASTALARWQDLVATYPDLPAPDLSGRDGAEEVFREAEAKVERSAQGEQAAHGALLVAQRELARSQGVQPVNVAAMEVAIAQATADAGRVRHEIDALALAYRELDASVEDFRSEHRQRIENAASAYFSRFSGLPGRTVTLDDDLAARVREASGDVAVPAQLSQGARDQLMLALRLAVADLLSGEVALPLIFDDPFHNWDEERLRGLEGALEELSAERQVLVLSHRTALRAWGTEVERTVA